MYRSPPPHCETSHILNHIAASEKEESNEKFKNFVTPILEKIRTQVCQYRSSGGSRPVIAIAGYSGVGKSYFICQLFNLLKKEEIRTAILRFDDYIDPKLSKVDEEEVTSVTFDI